MSTPNNCFINIALVAADECPLCTEVIDKTTLDSWRGEGRARVVAVSNTNPHSPVMVLGKKLGLYTLTDHHDCYQPQYDIHLIIVLTPDHALFDDVLRTRPDHIRILSFDVFKLFWEAITREEGKLRARNLEVETILNGIQDFIVVITPDRQIVDANEAFLKKMEFTRAEVIGRECHDVFARGNPPCLSDTSACPLNEVVQNEQPIVRELRRINRKGELRHFEVTFYPIWEDGRKISKFIEISRDITERKKKEEETTRKLEQMVEQRTHQLRETHGKLIHQNKMASLGKLSASVVHEINNPIAGILNLVMLIKRIASEDGLSSKQCEQFGRYLDLMESETKRISRIVSNLLSFSRQAKMEMKALDLNDLVEKILFLNHNSLKINGIKVVKQLSQNLPQVVGSADQLQQVFMNIISNATEAMEAQPKGRLSITTSFSAVKDTITIVFQDTGVGIPAHNLSQLFEPFFTTKKKGKGVGLGLSVAYGIIQEHGGAIHVTSKEGEETTFTVELPTQPAQG